MGRGTTTSAAVLVALVAGAARVARADGDATSAVEVRGSQAGGFASRTSEADSAREVTDAASLVEPLPGVHVRRLGADDSFATLSIRGSTSSEVAVILAGVPLTGGADPSLDLSTLPLWPGAQARVYRSFAPAALGQGSLGGTLVLDPPRLGAREGTDVWVAGGSFGAARMRIGEVRAVGDARIVAALSASRADDDFTYYDPHLSLLEGHDVYAERLDSGHAAVNGLVSYAVPAAGGVTVTVTALAQTRRQQLPGTVWMPTPFMRLDSNRELASIEAAKAAGRGVWSARAWARREGLALLDDPHHTAIAGPSRTDDTIVAAGASAGRTWQAMNPLSLEVRADAIAERFAPGTYVGATQPPGATRVSGGLAIDAELRPTDWLAAAASARVDAWADAGATTSESSQLRPTGHVGSDVALGPFTLAAHVGAVARPPSFVERFGDFGGFVGDPALRPESAWTVDAGAAYARRAGPLRVRFDSAAFATWADDLIVFEQTGALGQLRATNIGQARLLGAEATLRARLGPVEARVAWTGLATANEAQCIAPNGAPGASCERPQLPGRPRNDVVSDLLVYAGPVTLRYGFDAVTGIYADDKEQALVPDRILQSAGARLDVPGVRGLRLAADVRNLFDVRVATYAGATGPTLEPIGDIFAYPLPGRSVLVSLRWSERAAGDAR